MSRESWDRVAAISGSREVDGALVHGLALAGEVPLGRLWHAVPSFPAISEVWLRLLETYGL